MQFQCFESRDRGREAGRGRQPRLVSLVKLASLLGEFRPVRNHASKKSGNTQGTTPEVILWTIQIYIQVH